MTTDALLNVLQHPHSVPARRELAQVWLSQGVLQGELVDKQVRERDGLGLKSQRAVLDRIDELIGKHGREWAGPIATLASRYHYELGLVAGVTLTGETFIQRAGELVKVAPIVHLTLQPPIDLKALARVPELGQMTTLAVRGGGPWLDDASAEALAASPYVAGLRGLLLANGAITAPGLAALRSSPHLTDIVYILLTGNPCARLLEKHNDDFYIVAASAEPRLREAYRQLTTGYDPMGQITGWPPPSVELAYTD